MVSVMLGSYGCEVEQALSVADGLALARRGGFELILLDWQFKDGTGLELCREIRAFDQQTSILFFSGASYGSEMDEAIDAGAQGFLVKPVGVDELLRVVSHYKKTKSDP
jgi:DNA-binding response OmpR family regulator